MLFNANEMCKMEFQHRIYMITSAIIKSIAYKYENERVFFFRFFFFYYQSIVFPTTFLIIHLLDRKSLKITKQIRVC